MNQFKCGDRVKMWIGPSNDTTNPQGYWVHGEITIIKDDECKVLFDEEYAPDYWYYTTSDLVLDIKQ